MLTRRGRPFLSCPDGRGRRGLPCTSCAPQRLSAMDRPKAWGCLFRCGGIGQSAHRLQQEVWPGRSFQGPSLAVAADWRRKIIFGLSALTLAKSRPAPSMTPGRKLCVRTSRWR